MSDSLWPPWIVAFQNPLSMGFSRQEYWDRLPFPSPGDPHNPEIEPGSPTLQAVFFLPSELPGKSLVNTLIFYCLSYLVSHSQYLDLFAMSLLHLQGECIRYIHSLLTFMTTVKSCLWVWTVFSLKTKGTLGCSHKNSKYQLGPSCFQNGVCSSPWVWADWLCVFQK